MSFAASKQLVTPMGGGASVGDSAGLPWEAVSDDSLVKQETWLLSFIDILALLLTLFVLLLAYQDYTPESGGGTEAESPLTQATEFDLSLFTFRPGETLHGDFGRSGAGLLPLGEEGYPVGNEVEDLTAEAQPIEPVADEPSIDELPEVVPASFEQVADQQDARSLQVETPEDADRVYSPAVVLTAEEPITQIQEIEGPALPTPTEVIHQAFSQSPLQQHVDLLNRTGAVSVEISGNILFGLASAALSPEGQQLLNELAAVLSALPYELSVEGHTDNVPISSSRFPSNWELSSARAAMATRALIEQGLAADRLRAIGYGDTRPLTDNLTPEGRAKNRRVSFVLHVEDALTD